MHIHIKRITLCLPLALGLLVTACRDSILDEKPLSFLNPDVVLIDKPGFETAITGIHSAARDEIFGADNEGMHSMNLGTDGFTNGSTSNLLRNYITSLTPTSQPSNQWWEWAYLKMLPRVNTVIEQAEKLEVKWNSEAEKNLIVGEARFFRAYTYNVLINLYGGVPLVTKIETSPKTDYQRTSREEILEFAKQDLEFATTWLPEKPAVPGRITKAAANHLLAEVYISQGNNDKAIEAASKVIDDGIHALMKTRFGSKLALPGDVFSDLFRDKNQNTAVNTETIWALQFEYNTPGGVTYSDANNATAFGGNSSMRGWGAGYHNIKDPDGKAAPR